MATNTKLLDEFKKELNAYTQKLKEIQKPLKGKAGKESQKISNSLQELLQEAKKAYGKLETASAEEWGPLKAIANTAFENLRESFEETAHSLSEQVKVYADQIEEYSQEQIENTSEYIKSNPFKSTLIALGVGYIIGRICK